MTLRPVRPLLLVVAALLLSACASRVVNPVTGRTELSVMDEAAEVQEGTKGHEEVLKEYGVYANPRLQAYVNDLGQKLAGQSHRANLKWTFTVLDSPEINAFALPGGYVYVTRGIMAYLDSEAELAGVMGHEIGHVTARHGAQRATRQQATGIGVLAANVLGAVLEVGGVSGASSLASQASQAAAAGYIASYSRDQESQADQLGAEYLSRNRYDPQNMIDVIHVLKRQEQFAADMAKAEGKPGDSGANWLASHPANDKRLADIREYAARYKSQQGYADDGRARYLQAIAGMTFGDSAGQGLVRGRNFYHEELGIALTAPAGWKIQNTPEAIAVVNGTGDAALVVRMVPPKAGSTHEDVIRNVLKPVDGRSERRTQHGLAATHFSGTVRTQQGQPRPITVTLVTGPGDRTYWLQSAAKSDATRQRAQAGLAETEGSFRAMSAADRTAATPWSVQSVPFPRGGFGELAKSSPLPAQAAEAQLKLMNGAYGGGTEPKPGDVVKVVR
ncbi:MULTISPECIES: M48 family metalloprotease [Ramlibacter]|uniref:M48 family metalloprotease n=1 Tax=Ramlibacter pinisoli TaxID=2682844 RepID=A0A6N8J0X4_9BURK|nr:MULTISPECIES: M48 family metalloprotease [Ramlibacter]MBA2961893.1 M48 family metalloprotease [Ramlibacter sp. CGMCC 1.13660]MVQ31836.1 M48 family metalloprotease [Ramlibacter pinisoli]